MLLSFIAVILKVLFVILTLILSLKCLGWELSPRDSCKTKLMQVLRCVGGHRWLGIVEVPMRARRVLLSRPRGQLVKRTKLRHPKLVLRPMRHRQHHSSDLNQFASSLESQSLEIPTVSKAAGMIWPTAMRKFTPTDKHSPSLPPNSLIPTHPLLPNLFAFTSTFSLFIAGKTRRTLCRMMRHPH